MTCNRLRLILKTYRAVSDRADTVTETVITLPAIGTKVRCHKNLHRGVWSITLRGKVVAQVPEVVLANVTFKIRETARQRVIARRCREVHAWAEGEIAEHCPSGVRAPISHDPYVAATFIARNTGAAVMGAEFVHFTRAAGAVAIGEVQG